MVKYDFYRGLYLPSNRTIVNVVLHDLDLHFQCQTFSCYALAIKKCRQHMFPADLPRLVWPPAVKLLLFQLQLYVCPLTSVVKMVKSRHD